MTNIEITEWKKKKKQKQKFFKGCQKEKVKFCLLWQSFKLPGYMDIDKHSEDTIRWADMLQSHTPYSTRSVIQSLDIGPYRLYFLSQSCSLVFNDILKHESRLQRLTQSCRVNIQPAFPSLCEIAWNVNNSVIRHDANYQSSDFGCQSI